MATAWEKEKERTEFNRLVGARVRAVRLHTNTSPKAMARALGYGHVNSVYQLERGNTNYTPWHLSVVAGMLGVTLDYLLSGPMPRPLK